jgi:hypothetical protein
MMKMDSYDAYVYSVIIDQKNILDCFCLYQCS